MCVVARAGLVILVAALVAVLSVPALADPPQKITYQGCLYGSGGQPITGTRSLTLKIYDVETGGAALWTETHPAVELKDGVFSVELGSFELLGLAFDQAYWLGVRVDTDTEMTPRLPLNSAAYSLCSTNYVLKEGDSMTGPLVLTTDAGIQGAVTVNQTGEGINSVYAELSNVGSSAAALYAINRGLGRAGYFRVSNGDNTSEALYAESGGNGPAATLNGELKLMGTQGQVRFTDGTIQDTAAGVLSEAQKTGLVDGGDTSLHVHDSRYVLKNGDSGMTGLFTVNSGRLVINKDDAETGLTVNQGGTGQAGAFQVTDSSSTALALYAVNAGLGSAASFAGTNAGNTNAVLEVDNAGNGPSVLASSSGDGLALRVESTGDADAGLFTVTDADSYGYPLTVDNYGHGVGALFRNLNSSNANSTLRSTNAGGGTAVGGLNSGTGRAGYFAIDNAGNSSNALAGITYGNGVAVDGYTTGLGSAGFFKVSNSSSSVGAVEAETNGGGPAIKATTTGTNYAGTFVVDNTTSVGHALYATNTGKGATAYIDSGTNTNAAEAAVIIKNQRPYYGLVVSNSDSGGFPAAFVYSSSATTSGYALFVQSLSNRAAKLEGKLYVVGDAQITGSLSKGSGTFVQPHATDPAKEVAYAFFEGPEHAVFLRGRARLVNGRAEITTPEHFRMVAAEQGVRAQLTPLDLASKGLAAYSISRDRVLVGELMDGKGSYEFDYFITAVRDGFQAHAPIQKNVHFSADGQSPRQFEQTYAAPGMTTELMRKLMIQNGILNPDGSLNQTTARALGWKLAPETEALAAKQ